MTFSHLLQWVGHFHVVIVHFPIALLIGAAVAEAIGCFKAPGFFMPVVRFCLIFGALGAIAAGALGWIEAAAEFRGDASTPLALHRWIGTIAVSWAVALAIASEFEARRGRRTNWFRAMLFAGALLVGLAGHFGGLLVHGDHFFDL